MSDSELPWLEEVEDEDGARGVSAARMLGALALVLLAVAAIVAVFFWLGRQQPEKVAGPPELIRAPASDYKVKPDDPGGLDVAGESETAFETSAGQDVDSQLDTSRLQPGERPPPAAPKPDSPSATPAPAPEPPAPSGAPGATVQLGAYRNTAQAERAWSALSARFPALGGLSKMVVPYTAGGSSGFRLRAGAGSPGEAQQLCRQLQAAGESCFLVR